MIFDRRNLFCKFFPCHENLEDCTFCHCPFYPCKNEERGKYIRNGNKRYWDCSECNWIHKREVVDKIFKLIKQNYK